MRIWHESPEKLNLAVNIADNEELQNANTFLMIRERMLAGADSNEGLKDFEGYGLSLDNPIFVNGPFGQQTYLSRLRTSDGFGFLFQRLGSNGIIDIYELISFDGKHHLQLFIDMYHPNRSRQAPQGFWLNEEPCAFTGFTFASEGFPFNYEENYQRENADVRLAFAAPELIDEVIHFLKANGYGENSKGLPPSEYLKSELDFRDGEAFPWDEDDFESGAWRAKLDPDELAKSKELRGYMVPTPGDGVRVFQGPNGVYGWPPSKALAKRMKMDPNCIYDPVAVVVLEGYKKYRDMMSHTISYSFSLSPLCVSHDEDGFYSSFSVAGDFSMYQTHELMDYLTEFYFPLRIMPIKSWIYRDSTAPFDSAIVNFRWTNEIGNLWAPYTEMEGAGPQKASMPFLISDNGSIELLQARVVGRCPFCGEETVIWANEAKIQDIVEFSSKRAAVATPNLSTNERESLITGLHAWCSGI